MDVNLVNQKINTMNGYINLFNNNINSINELIKKRDKLEDLLDNLSKFQNNFSSIKDARKAKLKTFNNLSNVKSVNKYVEGMENLLEGKKFSDSYDGLTDAKNIVKNNARDIQEEIDRLNNENKNYGNIIDGLRQEINNLSC